MESFHFSDYKRDIDWGALRAAPREELLQELRLTRRLYDALDAIIENSKDGFFITDGQGQVIKVNRSYEELAGISREELVGRHMSQLEHTLISESASLVVLKTGKPVTIEQDFYHTNRRAYITSSPIFDENGDIMMIVSNNRDFEEIDQLRTKLIRAQALTSEYRSWLDAINQQLYQKPDIVAEDPKMLELLYQVTKLAPTDTTVLITGETGTGKEEIAKCLHENSPRAKNPFIRVNCGAISPNLIDSELFGYEKGAFTGASASGKMGYFEVAHRGTLFLDEIGELPLDLQVKLLRVLQEREILRLGGTRPVKVDVRVVAATNQDLDHMVEEKTFRQDLYYRLNVVHLQLPPLRERTGDIRPLAQKFLTRYNEKYHTQKELTRQALHAMEQYAWPGNVRELKNIVEQVVIMCESHRITARDLPFYAQSGHTHPNFLDLNQPLDLEAMLERMEYDYIRQAYSKFGTLKLAAAALGMNISTFARKKRIYSEKYGISEEIK
ncbi:sigma 54-interacting transcriptional regulator [Pseudoflavonifractor sp. 524-17]|uniref:sigma-54 interaction domain-containing protein n=1 Tax=Pseudoflavonifractor sp. 524-17 TaxID=2304577 RepID=UPI00192A633E|nr:sigma 54-interacting transcriptional regulator [Pseudoflavonifractor sp. 524-17]